MNLLSRFSAKEQADIDLQCMTALLRLAQKELPDFARKLQDEANTEPSFQGWLVSLPLVEAWVDEKAGNK